MRHLTGLNMDFYRHCACSDQLPWPGKGAIKTCQVLGGCSAVNIFTLYKLEQMCYNNLWFFFPPCYHPRQRITPVRVPPSLLHPRKDTIYAPRTSSRLHKNSLPVRPALAPKRRRGSQSENAILLMHGFYSNHFHRSDLKDIDNCVFSDLDPKGFDVYTIMSHQGKTLRVLVSKARSDFFTSPKGLVSFYFF